MRTLLRDLREDEKLVRCDLWSEDQYAMTKKEARRRKDVPLPLRYVESPRKSLFKNNLVIGPNLTHVRRTVSLDVSHEPIVCVLVSVIPLSAGVLPRAEEGLGTYAWCAGLMTCSFQRLARMLPMAGLQTSQPTDSFFTPTAFMISPNVFSFLILDNIPSY